jgi:hypothetical protein
MPEPSDSSSGRNIILERKKERNGEEMSRNVRRN